ncbi:MAG: hypothetical protein ACK4OP_14935, partial [Gemmobacter sp.]
AGSMRFAFAYRPGAEGCVANGLCCTNLVTVGRPLSPDRPTGLLCGELVGVDIDVLNSDHAYRLTGIAAEMLGMSSASRIGRAPKILLAFRTDAPFDKVQTSEFHMLDGTVARVEVLATGQQFVAFGIHPDTKAPHHWPECSPLDVPLHELPVVSRDRCAAFIAAVEDYLRKVGGQTGTGDFIPVSLMVPTSQTKPSIKGLGREGPARSKAASIFANARGKSTTEAAISPASTVIQQPTLSR